MLLESCMIPPVIRDQKLPTLFCRLMAEWDMSNQEPATLVAVLEALDAMERPRPENPVLMLLTMLPVRNSMAPVALFHASTHSLNRMSRPISWISTPIFFHRSTAFWPCTRTAASVLAHISSSSRDGFAVPSVTKPSSRLRFVMASTLPVTDAETARKVSPTPWNVRSRAVTSSPARVVPAGIMSRPQRNQPMPGTFLPTALAPRPMVFQNPLVGLVAFLAALPDLPKPPMMG